MHNCELFIPDSRGTYPYRERRQGYDFPELFSSITNRATPRGESGLPVSIKVAATELSIESTPRPDFLLNARIDGDTMELNLKTKRVKPLLGGKGEHHPDMFAKEFVDYAMQFFEANGISVRNFLGMWQSYSDNYAAFMENLKTMDPTDAARYTWTGRTMARHGFIPKEVMMTGSHQELNRHTVLVDFTRT